MTRDVRVYVADILESIRLIEQYARGVSREDFMANTQVQDAVLRRLEIIGEAVKGIGDDVRSRYPTIPWKQIAGLRDVLIHTYFGVTLERIWKVIEDDLPELNKMLSVVYQDLTQIEDTR
jgi:uncharacterized protein with HEPN domain